MRACGIGKGGFPLELRPMTGELTAVIAVELVALWKPSRRAAPKGKPSVVIHQEIHIEGRAGRGGAGAARQSSQE